MTVAEQRDFIQAGISRIINSHEHYYISDWEAGLLARMVGFASAAQILEQQLLLRKNPQAVRRWCEVYPEQFDPYLFR